MPGHSSLATDNLSGESRMHVYTCNDCAQDSTQDHVHANVKYCVGCKEHITMQLTPCAMTAVPVSDGRDCQAYACEAVSTLINLNSMICMYNKLNGDAD